MKQVAKTAYAVVIVVVLAACVLSSCVERDGNKKPVRNNVATIEQVTADYGESQFETQMWYATPGNED